MNTPLMVTIRCTVYNHEPYIRECLEGFVMQKTNFRFEAIVHDDASTDGSAAIIREYAEKYPDIIKPIYQTENQYSKRDGSLRRILNEHTHGKYVALCEGDDYWIDPLKLQKQVDFLEANEEYSMCFTNVDRYTQSTGVIENNFFSDEISDEITSVEKYIETAYWIAPCTWLYRWSFFDGFMEWIGSRRFAVGDLAVVSYLLSKGSVAFINETTAVYRIHSGGVSQNKQPRKAYEFATSVFNLQSYICETLLDKDVMVMAKIQEKFINSNLFLILSFEKKKEVMHLLNLSDLARIKGKEIKTTTIKRYYCLFALIAKLKYQLFK